MMNNRSLCLNRASPDQLTRQSPGGDSNLCCKSIRCGDPKLIWIYASPLPFTEVAIFRAVDCHTSLAAVICWSPHWGTTCPRVMTSAAASIELWHEVKVNPETVGLIYVPHLICRWCEPESGQWVSPAGCLLKVRQRWKLFVQEHGRDTPLHSAKINRKRSILFVCVAIDRPLRPNSKVKKTTIFVTSFVVSLFAFSIQDHCQSTRIRDQKANLGTGEPPRPGDRLCSSAFSPVEANSLKHLCLDAFVLFKGSKITSISTFDCTPTHNVGNCAKSILLGKLISSLVCWLDASHSTKSRFVGQFVHRHVPSQRYVALCWVFCNVHWNNLSQEMMAKCCDASRSAQSILSRRVLLLWLTVASQTRKMESQTHNRLFDRPSWATCRTLVSAEQSCERSLLWLEGCIGRWHAQVLWVQTKAIVDNIFDKAVQDLEWSQRNFDLVLRRIKI